MSSFATGKEWLVHTAANMAASMAASRRFLTAAAAQRLDTVLSAGNLWPLGLVFAGAVESYAAGRSVGTVSGHPDGSPQTSQVTQAMASPGLRLWVLSLKLTTPCRYSA